MKIEVTYECGHEAKFDSPGLSDPAGVYAETATGICPDGILRINDFQICYACKEK